jgi:hypothetical protein
MRLARTQPELDHNVFHLRNAPDTPNIMMKIQKVRTYNKCGKDPPEYWNTNRVDE